ncbi:MAG: hypothetical protein MPJ24_03745 [Pirellulaceae bacterium]|nr:hypothetical protein [Pirellulaceae bacterium]
MTEHQLNYWAKAGTEKKVSPVSDNRFIRWEAITESHLSPSKERKTL